MRGFGRSDSGAPADAFESYLNTAVTATDARLRNQMLLHWQAAPAARLAHPREDHLLPLMVAAGAADDDAGYRICLDRAMNVSMASYQFGGENLAISA